MIFYNCIIQNPEGTPISRCSKRKKEWYVNNQLATIVNESYPEIIKLNFYPRHGFKPSSSLIEGKSNICVVCGASNDLIRHHIVPYSFMKHYKKEYKMDMIDDIVALCKQCHNEYELKSHEKRKELSILYNIPITGIDKNKATKVRKAVIAANVLLDEKNIIPKDKLEALKDVVKNFLKKECLTKEDIIQLQKHKIQDEPDYVNFCKYITQKIDCNVFAKDWRLHFVETMKPKFMSKNWDINRVIVQNERYHIYDNTELAP